MSADAFAGLDYYQTLAARTAKGLDETNGLAMAVFGLTGELGEVVELLKKHVFHGKLLNQDEITKEIGDMLWYVALLCSKLDISLGEVAERNIQKLQERYPEGFTLGGGIRP